MEIAAPECRGGNRGSGNRSTKVHGVEIAGVEIVAPKCRGGNHGSGNRGRRKNMESEGFKNVFLTILTENRVMIHTAEQVSFASIGNNAHDRKTTHNEIKKMTR